jgi:hypothetical protein
MSKGKIITIYKSAIQNFCNQWPCHNIPENTDLIVCYFYQGDLVYYQLCDSKDKEIVAPSDAEEALSVLLDEAFKHCIKVFIPGTIGNIYDYK